MVFCRRFYAVLLLGPEKRNLDRLTEEGQLSFWLGIFAYSLSVWLLLPLMTATGVLSLYVIKSLVGLTCSKATQFFTT